ncbi:MAG: PAS domain S-box protein [Halobacteriota archaeon]|nr:PAS domain S-box protein [Halobacteriota archaeon]
MVEGSDTGLLLIERDQNDDALKRELSNVKKYLDCAGDLVVALDCDQDVIHINRRGCEILGCEEEEIIGTNWFDTSIPKKGRYDAVAAFQKLLTGEMKSVEPYEDIVFTKSGEVRVIRWKSTAIKDDSGKILGVLNTGVDITDQKQMEKDFFDIEQKYKTLFENKIEGVLIFDAQTMEIVSVNQTAVEIYGYSSKEEVIGKSPLDFIPEEYRATVFKDITNELFKKDLKRVREYRTVTKDGIERWIEVYGTKIEFEGKLAGLVSFKDITEKKHFEIELRESEKRYSAIVEGANDGIIIIRKDLKIVYSNKRAADMFGYTIEELLEVNLLKAVCPSSLKGALNVFKNRMAGEDTASNYNIEVFHKDGHVIPVEVSSAKTEYEGKPADIVFVRDISEREQGKKIFEELKGSYQALIENSPDIIAQFDETGKIITANTKTAEFLNLSLNEMIGCKISELLPKELIKNAFKLMLNVIGSDEPSSYEDYVKERYYQIYLTPVETAGKRRTYQLIAHDITDRKDVEMEALSSKRELEDIMDSMIDSVFIGSSKAKIINVNDSTLLLSGYSREELIGSFPTMLLSKDSISSFIENLKELQAGIKVESLELSIKRKDGSEVPVSTNVSFTTDLKGRPDKLVVVLRDITERKKYEKRLKETLNDYKNSMGELEQFTFIASHDLQEPLRMVASFVQLLSLRYRGKFDSDADEYIDYAVEGVKRMKGMIDNLMDLSSIGTSNKTLKPVECEKVLNLAISALDTKIKDSGAEILREPLPVVRGDNSRLIELFTNLINNAIKYRGPESPRIHISSEEREDNWVFSVQDNGIGIDPENVEHVFKIFRRMDKKRSGTGIGLATCKRIVQHHGGRIWVESEPGEGTTFYFTIPVMRK